MKLTETQKRYLRKLAHPLKPLVLIGQNGLTDSVLREIDLTIAHHELIKIRVSGADRDDKKVMIGKICEQVNAELVQQIGHVAVLYRRAEKPKIELPS
jgi:RNA-binding protein